MFITWTYWWYVTFKFGGCSFDRSFGVGCISACIRGIGLVDINGCGVVVGGGSSILDAASVDLVAVVNL